MSKRATSEPVQLLEDAENGDRLLIYTTGNGIKVELRYAGEQLWASQDQMSEMFGVNVPSISRHLKNVFEEGELDAAATVSKIERVRSEGQRQVTRTIDVYSLDAIISVGYRVNSKQGTMFRRWATDKLVQFATKGFVIDVERLENPSAPDYFQELLDKIRHIRASERRMWTRVLELAELCSDFDSSDPQQLKSFYATMQNALHWAVTQHTAAEVIYDRVDAAKNNAGVAQFRGALPTVEEAQIAKNYYGEMEIKALNLLTSMVLEFFESQAQQQRLTGLNQFLLKMRELIRIDGRPLIPAGHRGSRSKAEADRKASIEIKAFRDRIKVEKEAAGELALKEIAQGIKSLPRRERKLKPHSDA